MFYPTHLSRCTKRNKREEPVKQSTACNGCWNLHTCSVHIKPLEVSGAWRWYGDTCQLNGFLGTGLLPFFWLFPDVTLRFTLQPEEHSHPRSRGENLPYDFQSPSEAVLIGIHLNSFQEDLRNLSVSQNALMVSSLFSPPHSWLQAQDFSDFSFLNKWPISVPHIFLFIYCHAYSRSDRTQTRTWEK